MPERDGAAVHIDLRRIEPQLADDGNRLRGERLVQLEQIDVADLKAGAIEHLPHRRDRPDAHHLRIDAGRHVREDARERLLPQRVCFFRRRNDRGGGAVVDAGRIAGGHRAVLLEGRLQRAELFRRGPRARVLIRVDENRIAFALRHRYRHDLVFETPFRDRAHGARLALRGERVLIRARHLVTRRHFFGGDAHVGEADRAGQPLVQHRVDRVAVAHAIAPPRAREQIRRVRHRLCAAGNHRVHIADADRLDGVHDRLHSGSADAVDRLARNLDRKPRFQSRLSGDVHSRARLQHAAHHGVPDVRWWDAGARDRFTNDDRAEIHRAYVLQRAAECADWRPARGEDHDLEVFVHPGIIVLRSRAS